MVTNEIFLSIVVPVFNGENSLKALAKGAFEALPSGDSVELIYIDDGSKDASWQVICELKKTYGPKIAGIKLSQNYGQHNALMCGLAIARGDLILTMDDDLRHSPSQITKLIKHQKETNADLVYGIGSKYQGSTLREMASDGLGKSARFFSMHGNTQGSSFRLLTRALVDEIKTNQGKTIFLDEIVHWYTTRIEHIEVDESAVAKKSRYSILKLFRLYFRIIHDYAIWPLKFMIYIGAFSSVITFLLGCRFIYKRLYLRVDVEGFTATIVTILFSASIILFCLGVVGLYIYKLYQIQSGKPSYTVKKII